MLLHSNLNNQVALPLMFCSVFFIKRSESSNHSAHTGTTAQFTSENLWPNGVVHYRIDERNVRSSDRQLILRVMNMIENSTCIRFIPAIPRNASYLFLTFGDQCSSYVGRKSPTAVQNLTLAKHCLTERGIIHELIHALGFAHEHTRLDRHGFVEVNLTNVKKEFRYTFEEVVDGHAILDFSVPYDFASVMHYGPYDFALDNTIPIIRSKIDPFYARVNLQISYLDVYKINLLYRCHRELVTYFLGCVDYFDECYSLNEEGPECKVDQVRNVCRKKCGVCREQYQLANNSIA